MYVVVIEAIVAAVVALYAVARGLQLLFRIDQGASKREFLSSLRSFASERVGRRGVSLLCRDCGDEGRLRALLSVEYPDYEVVITADSLRNAESLQRIISRYRMVAVDRGELSEEWSSVRRLYRSTHRCYRRLILLDVSSVGRDEDFEAACEIATYDLLLPLWGDEVLLPGAVERLVAEVALGRKRSNRPVTTLLGAAITLYPRAALCEKIGSGGAERGHRPRSILLYEPLAVGGASWRWKRWLLFSLVGLVAVACVSALISRFLAIFAVALLVAVGALMLLAFVAHRLVMREEKGAVGYGEILYRFFENLLPWIWKIRK